MFVKHFISIKKLFDRSPNIIVIGIVILCFSEGVVAYSIPQGMVRGSMLELMDHTFDGHEDSLSGDLRGGLGQLIDGVYGWDNFKAAGINGHVKGDT